MKKLFLPLLFLPFLSVAQEKPVKTDTVALYRQWEQQALKETPVYILAFSARKSASRNLFYIKGYQRAGQLVDDRRRPLNPSILVWQVLPRQEVKK